MREIYHYAGNNLSFLTINQHFHIHKFSEVVFRNNSTDHRLSITLQEVNDNADVPPPETQHALPLSYPSPPEHIYISQFLPNLNTRVCIRCIHLVSSACPLAQSKLNVQNYLPLNLISPDVS